MAKKKSKKKKTQSKAKSVKDLVKKEYTDEEKARLAKHQERKRRKPVKFKTVKSDSDNPTIALQDPDEPLLAVKMSEALGTVDPDMQGHLLEQVIQTFTGVVSTDGEDKEATIAAANIAPSRMAVRRTSGTSFRSKPFPIIAKTKILWPNVRVSKHFMPNS